VEETSDEQLMRQALAGDKAAYNALLTHIGRILRPYLAKRLQNKSEIDDVLQETLISIHKARHTYDGARALKPWIFAIAHYRLQDYLRKHYIDPLRHAGELSEAEHITAGTSNDLPLTYESIHGEIEALPGKQPRILQLLHREGYTAKEVAAKLGMKESAVKVAAHRAYKILRNKLVGS